MDETEKPRDEVDPDHWKRNRWYRLGPLKIRIVGKTKRGYLVEKQLAAFDTAPPAVVDSPENAEDSVEDPAT